MISGITISIARPFLSNAVSPKAPAFGVLFTGSDHAVSSRLALNENEHTLNTAFPEITGIC